MFLQMLTYFHLEELPPVFHESSVLDLFKKIPSLFKDLSLRIEGEVSPQATLVNAEHIFIGEGSVVEAGAFIKGPCWIGRNSQIRHGAYLRGNVWVGDHCVIGHATEVKNAIFFPYAKAGHFAYVGDSIIGHRVNLGAGVKCANWKLYGDEVVIRDQGIPYHTGLKKLGAIIGDDVSIGCNAVTSPGTFIGKDTAIYPLVHVWGVIPPASLVKTGGVRSRR